MNEPHQVTCSVCGRVCDEPLQLTMDGEATCLLCISSVIAHIRVALRPEARDDGR